MLRLFREMVETCFLHFAYSFYVAGFDEERVRQDWTDMLDRGGRGSDVPLHIRQMVSLILSNDRSGRGNRNMVNPVEVLDDMAKALRSQVNPSQGDASLIDRIVHILQLPFALNQLNQRRMRELRSALLVPEELAAANELLGRIELSCRTCHRRLEQGEMVTLYTADSMPVVYCIRCMSPELLPCQGPDCTNVVPVPQTIYRSLEKVKSCGCDRVPKPPSEPAINRWTNDVPIPPGNVMDPVRGVPVTQERMREMVLEMDRVMRHADQQMGTPMPPRQEDPDDDGWGFELENEDPVGEDR